MRIPSATYRLQFNAGFGFTEAMRFLDYLRDLGISDIYASPLFCSRRGSVHGYDSTNPNEINPEIGSAEEFEAFVEALKIRDMGLLLDVVPNHMAASIENPWWLDVLAKGEASPYARFFDVNWESGRVLLPILRRPYGETLEAGKLTVRQSQEDGKPVLRYFDMELPLDLPEDMHDSLETLNGRRGDPRSFDALDRVISQQRFRLAYWRKASESINYRRFFDISDLIGMRAEDPEVFSVTHWKVLQLVAAGVVTGLRIDHIDGLLDPKTYLDRLPDVYVIVEKILAGRESLPSDWKTHGTTGYDFLNIVNGALVDGDGYRQLEKSYADFIGQSLSQTEVVRARKRQVLRELFAGEAETMTQRLTELAEDDRHARDLLSDDLRAAFIEVTACLPVYRTYTRSCTVSQEDRRHIDEAVEQAAASQNEHALAFIHRVLLVEPPDYIDEGRKSAWLQFVMSWQQFTGPVMAKGLEDTTFYVHHPLDAVNEVGGNPDGPEVYFGVSEFHRRNAERHCRWPYTLNASSTHDTKRSEDVRARIDVLSEMPAEWSSALRRWSRWNPNDTAPDRNEQVFIYQTLIGAWPIDRTRLHQYIVKALRESKTHSSWLHTDEQYEQSVLGFIDRLMDPGQSRRFLADFLRFQKKVAFYGALNSLSQTLLKITSPGIPDFYQGTELWDLSLADPDNRRPVDCAARIDALEFLLRRDRPEKHVAEWRNGRIKMWVIRKSLQLRKEWPEVFGEGAYIPVSVSGHGSPNIIAFVRRLGTRWTFVAVPRLTSHLVRPGQMPIGDAVWRDTKFELPSEAPANFANVFTGRTVRNATDASAVFASFPVALLHS